LAISDAPKRWTKRPGLMLVFFGLVGGLMVGLPVLWQQLGWPGILFTTSTDSVAVYGAGLLVASALCAIGLTLFLVLDERQFYMESQRCLEGKIPAEVKDYVADLFAAGLLPLCCNPVSVGNVLLANECFVAGYFRRTASTVSKLLARLESDIRNDIRPNKRSLPKHLLACEQLKNVMETLFCNEALRILVEDFPLWEPSCPEAPQFRTLPAKCSGIAGSLGRGVLIPLASVAATDAAAGGLIRNAGDKAAGLLVQLEKFKTEVSTLESIAKERLEKHRALLFELRQGCKPRQVA